MEQKNAWLSYKEEELAAVEACAEGYKAFISKCKTERECVDEIVKMAEKAGYTCMEAALQKGSVAPGDKFYAVNKKKSIVLFHIGEAPLTEGFQILGAHIDSPRLDIKQNPLFETEEMALLDTHYYGGIKKYQWVTLPLAIHGVVAKKDGSIVNISIGEALSEPVVGITDLLIHLAADQLSKKASVVIEGENLDILVGSRPIAVKEDENGETEHIKNAVKQNILHILKEKYDIEEEDFLSAELEAVPAGPARDFGLDASMVMGYGQDDRICAYTSCVAQLQQKEIPKRTSVCIFCDKEEIGSVGATSMSSKFFERTVAELLAKSGETSYGAVMKTLSSCNMLSSDVSAAVDPNYESAFEKKNAAFMGKGLVFNKFTGARGKSGSNDASAEYVAYLRRIMDDAGVHWQTAELGKVDQGGGGTIAYITAEYGMEVIDSGIAVLNMHSPWEVSSKADIYEAVKGYQAFLNAC